MPRKGPAPRRDLMPDPIHRSVLVTQFVNKVLLRGKRSAAERIVYDALEEMERKTGTDPLATLKRALDKLRALLERRGVTSTTAALAAGLSTQAVIAAPLGLAATR